MDLPVVGVVTVKVPAGLQIPCIVLVVMRLPGVVTAGAHEPPSGVQDFTCGVQVTRRALPSRLRVPFGEVVNPVDPIGKEVVRLELEG